MSLISLHLSSGKVMQTIGWRLGIVLFAVSLLFSPGCRTRTDIDIRDSGRIIETVLFFGLSKPDGGTVSESEWEKFVDEYITPRFKEGLTTIDADGQWMDDKGKVIKEKTKMVILFHHDNEHINAAIEYIRDKYKELFEQKAVLRISTYVGERHF